MSDLHLGAWTGDALLSRPFARERLAPHLDAADELILNGDVFDFLFSSVANAFEQAQPFFDLVAERMAGKRVVFLAGNHDHHVAVRELRSAVELEVACGTSDAFTTEHRGFLQGYFDRKLPDVETAIVYPSYRVGDVHVCHGHYLDAHMGGSLANRILTRATWTIAGGRPDALTEGDYESVIVPLTELLFTVAQMPRGVSAQMAFLQEFERIGRLLGVAAAVKRAAGRVRRPRNLAGGCSPMGSVPAQLLAYVQVVRNLGWDRDATKFVFSHTHQPLGGVASGELRFWNTGSWIYEPPLGRAEEFERYCRQAWPGTAILIDTDAAEPELIECLADQNPLHSNGRVELRQTVTDRFTDRARACGDWLRERRAA